MDLGLYDLGDGGGAAIQWQRRHKANEARRARRKEKRRQEEIAAAERAARKAARLQAKLERAAQKLAEAAKPKPSKRGTGPIVQMSGRYGRLTILRISDRRTDLGGVFWWCRCDCGWVGEIRGSTIRYGQAKSCGCLSREIARKNFANAKRDRRTPIRLLSHIMKALRHHGRHMQARRLKAHIAKLRREKAAAWGREYFKKWRAMK